LRDTVIVVNLKPSIVLKRIIIDALNTAYP
jgi:hypothetical protein